MRRLDTALTALLRDHPAVLLTGPRATGKTTTALNHVRSVIRLDRADEAVAIRADPDAALAAFDEPILIDEWQVVPEVLGAIKRAVDLRPTPGRFVVTGSVRGDLDSPTWPGTGRLIRTPVFGLTHAEQVGRLGQPLFVERLLEPAALQAPTDPLDLVGYIDVALRGGFPEPALSMGAAAGARWMGSYAEQLVTRDALDTGAGRDPVRLRRYLEALALNSAGIVDHLTLYEAARISKATASAYDSLLQNLLIAEELPSWTSNRLKRLVLSPKRYLVDSSLVSGVLGMDRMSFLRDGDMLGRLIDTFVVAQLRAELPFLNRMTRMFHLRTEKGQHEIDLVIEVAGSSIIGIEIKATSAPKLDDARHLIWMRDSLGERFALGVVLHTGPRMFSLSDRVIALPIASIWDDGSS